MKETTYSVDPETVFPQVEKMIYSQAWKCANTYPVTFEEARSIAYWAFMRSCQDYNPKKKMKFTSWCYYWVWCELKTWVTKRTVDPLTFVEIDDDLCGAAAPEKSDYKELVADLSEDAKEMIHLFTEAASELGDMSFTTPNQLVRKVKKHMIAKGKDQKSVDEAFLTLRATFQAAWA